MSFGARRSLASHRQVAVRGPGAFRRTRPAWFGLLAAGALLVGGCATTTGVQPVSLQKLPPKDPPARTALPADPAGVAPGSTDSSTSPDGLRVRCATLDLALPGDWKVTPSDNGAAYKLSTDAGGGVVNVIGFYFSGERAQQTEATLRSAVRGDDGDAVTIQQSSKEKVIGYLAAKRGGEWRLAQAFPDQQQSEMVKIAYAPAGSASAKAVAASSSLLQEAVGKARVLDPGGCER
ncbi:hypothetical protein [Actinopolymorpha pittospori]